MTINLCILSRKNKTGYDSVGQFVLEKSRPQELESLVSSNVKPTDASAAHASLIRANPERTNRFQLNRLVANEAKVNHNAIRLNPIASFQNYASKLTTFDLWSQHGLATPDYLALPLWCSFSVYEQALRQLAENGCYLRTSNEDSGKGMYFFKEYSRQVFKSTIRKLHWRALINKVRIADLIAVKPVDNRVNGLGYIYRVHLVGNTIVGGYAICSEQSIIHVRDLSVEHIPEFIQANHHLMEMLADEKFSSQIVKALRSLRIHVAAVEFFVVDEQPVFLEVNPLWGGLHRFGSDQFQQALYEHELPANVALWLNPLSFYNNYWSAISDLVTARGEYGDKAIFSTALG